MSSYSKIQHKENETYQLVPGGDGVHLDRYVVVVLGYQIIKILKELVVHMVAIDP